MQPAASANNVLLPGSCNLQVDLGPDTLSCDTVLLDAGNPGASYLWSDGSTDRTLSVADTGVYWVDVTVDCCTKRDSVWVALDQLPIASFIWAQDPPGSLHAWFQSTSLFADSISWTFSALVLTGDSVSHDFPDMGQYLVCITAYNDCGQDTWCVPVDIFPFTGTDGTGASEVGTLKLFPNPAVDLVFVSHPAIQLTDRILLLDGLGRSVVVPFEITASGRAEIRVQRLAHGSYTVHVLGNDGQRKASGTLIR